MCVFFILCVEPRHGRQVHHSAEEREPQLPAATCRRSYLPPSRACCAPGGSGVVSQAEVSEFDPRGNELLAVTHPDALWL